MAQDYKKAQIQGTASTGTYATLYTTPAGKQALISTILVCNTDVNNPVTVRVGFDDTAGTPDTALGEWLVYDAVVAAGDTLTLSLGISMDQQKFLRVSSSNTNANFTAFVVEIGAGGNSISPAFRVSNNTTRSNVTGDNTVYTIPFENEDFDNGSDYNTSTGVFTAPVAGVYHFSAHVLLTGQDSFGGGWVQLILNCSNGQNAAQQQTSVVTLETYYVYGTVYMDAGDTAKIDVLGQTGTKTISVHSSAPSYAYTQFSGHLVG